MLIPGKHRISMATHITRPFQLSDRATVLMAKLSTETDLQHPINLRQREIHKTTGSLNPITTRMRRSGS